MQPKADSSRVRTNLPASTTAVVGREREIEDLRTLLNREDVRLVTLIGPPGTGKTRLAMEAARELLSDFEDGVWFVPLHTLRDPGLVLTAVAKAIGLRDTGEEPLEQQILAWSRGKSSLLVIDNFEQVNQAGPVVADLLAGSGDLKVLVTSRAPLKLYGEREYPVVPLGIPSEGRSYAPEELRRVPAVALFVERAAAVQPSFALTRENAQAVSEICTHLDGLPLAIELAAARVKLLSPRALLARLQDRLDLLTGGSQDRPARHQTLRGAVDWSYELLTATEQTLFRRLSVFAGGASLESAEAVCQFDGEQLDLLNGVASLVDKNLIRSIEQPAGEPRFAMLETIRAYGVEQLVASGEDAAAHRRYAEHFLALAEQMERALSGPDQATWLDRLESEHDNARAALRWSLDARETWLAARMASALWRFWYTRGYLAEAHRWLDGVLQQRDSVPEAMLTKILNAAGNVAGMQGDRARSGALHGECLDLRRRAGDLPGIAQSLNNLGIVHQMQGEHAKAVSLYAEALAVLETLGDTRAIALTLHNLGDAAYMQGDFEQAQGKHEESLHLLRTLGDQRSIAHALNDLGNVALRRGEYRRAHDLHAESLALYHKIGDPLGAAQATQGLGAVARTEKRYEEAARLLGESLVLMGQVNAKRGAGRSLDELARVMVVRKEPRAAAMILGGSDAIRATVSAPRPRLEQEEYEQSAEQARLMLGQREYAQALALGAGMDLDQLVALVENASVPTQQQDTLTQRERQVAVLVARGRTNRQIGRELVITEATAAVHVKHVLNKLGFESRAQIAAWAASQGLLA